jgi:hypothetical protein
MADIATELHDEVLRVLLEKIEDDPYPSVTMMDLVEEMLLPEDIPAYAEILLDKIRGDRFPSLDMLDRVRQFA